MRTYLIFFTVVSKSDSSFIIFDSLTCLWFFDFSLILHSKYFIIKGARPRILSSWFKLIFKSRSVLICVSPHIKQHMESISGYDLNFTYLLKHAYILVTSPYFYIHKLLWKLTASFYIIFQFERILSFLLLWAKATRLSLNFFDLSSILWFVFDLYSIHSSFTILYYQARASTQLEFLF